MAASPWLVTPGAGSCALPFFFPPWLLFFALCEFFRTPTPSWNLGCGGVSGVSGRRSWAHGCCWIVGRLRRGGRRGGESTGPYGFVGQRVQEHRRVGGCPPPPSSNRCTPLVFFWLTCQWRVFGVFLVSLSVSLSVLSLCFSKKPKYVQLSGGALLGERNFLQIFFFFLG